MRKGRFEPLKRSTYIEPLYAARDRLCAGSPEWVSFCGITGRVGVEFLVPSEHVETERRPISSRESMARFVTAVDFNR